MSEHRLEIGVFEGVGQFGPKFQVEGDILYKSFYRFAKVDASPFHFVKMLAYVSVVLSQFTRLTDRQIDGQTDISLMAKALVAYNATP